jgi:hypothetical protein
MQRNERKYLSSHKKTIKNEWKKSHTSIICCDCGGRNRHSYSILFIHARKRMVSIFYSMLRRRFGGKSYPVDNICEQKFQEKALVCQKFLLILHSVLKAKKI